MRGLAVVRVPVSQMAGVVWLVGFGMSRQADDERERARRRQEMAEVHSWS
jgi:hypothetical protein